MLSRGVRKLAAASVSYNQRKRGEGSSFAILHLLLCPRLLHAPSWKKTENNRALRKKEVERIGQCCCMVARSVICRPKCCPSVPARELSWVYVVAAGVQCRSRNSFREGGCCCFPGRSLYMRAVQIAADDGAVCSGPSNSSSIPEATLCIQGRQHSTPELR